MKKQFSSFITFFDIGIGNENLPFYTIEYCAGGFHKKRAIANQLIWKKLIGKKLKKEDEDIACKYIEGTAYQEQKKHFQHCALCAETFKRESLNLFSKQFKYWELAFPTSPYTPAGIMIFLKDRKNVPVEVLDELSPEAFAELEKISKALYSRLHPDLEELCGINILFHQISTSQACIHGHLEFMFKNIDEKLGCSYLNERPVDICSSYLNKQIKHDNRILYTQEGIRLNIKSFSVEEIKKIIKMYREETISLFQFFTRLRNEYKKGNIDVLKNTLLQKGIENIDISNILFGLTPAPINYVYFTYYRNEFIISVIPELILKSIPIKDVINDEYFLYNLKFDANQISAQKYFLIERHPLIRPSIKLRNKTSADESINSLKIRVKTILSEEIL